MRKDALLLLGPTGVGKSPLGDLLERHGRRDRPCRHFDFGRALRRAAGAPQTLTAAAAVIVRRVLAEGTLLEDDEFFVAEELFAAFAAEPGPDEALVVLNGLPRHVGQARDVERLVRVREVIHLEADARALEDRIRRNSGGDRTGRLDDLPEAVAARLARFEARTRPLLEHYRRGGVAVVTLTVGVETQARDLLGALGA